MLYAPTWEGWDGNPGNTSLIAAGENIVRALLADPGVRLLYKPHPLTGSVDPRAGAADLRIRELIRAANRERGGPRPDPSAAAERDRRAAELDRLTAAGFRAAADQVERMLRQPAPPRGAPSGWRGRPLPGRRRTGRRCRRGSTRSSRTPARRSTPASTGRTC